MSQPEKEMLDQGVFQLEVEILHLLAQTASFRLTLLEQGSKAKEIAERVSAAGTAGSDNERTGQ